MTNKNEVETPKEKVKPVFSKEQLINSKKYFKYRDALNALLKDGETYSFEQVDKTLENFYKGGNK